MEDGAATGQAGIGAGQEVDADPFFESVVRPEAFDHDDAPLQAVEGAGYSNQSPES